MRRLHWAILAFSVVLFAILFFSFRDSTLDPIIDTGRDLYAGEQIAAGHQLYRDIVYNYPPAAPLILALIVVLFGGGLATFQVLGALVALITAATLYVIGRTSAGPITGAIAALLFIALSFTGASTWGANYIFPYAYAATIGMAFSLLFLHSLLRYLFVAPQRKWLALAILFATLATWSKIEYALLVGATLVFATLYYRLPLRALLTYAALIVCTMIVFSASFGSGPFDISWIRDQILSSSLLHGTSSEFFYAQVSGTASARASIAVAMKGVILVSIIVVLIRHAGHDRAGSGGVPESPLLAQLLLAAIVAASWFLAGEPLFRAWAILQLLLIPVALFRGRGSPFALLLVFSLLSTARIVLRTSPVWYGFVLAVPLYVLMAYLFFHELPRRKIYRHPWTCLWAPVIVLTLYFGLAQQFSRYSAKAFPIVTPRGTFLDSNSDRASVLTSVIGYLATHRGNGLVVFPEGVSINYFSAIPSPLSRYIFTPIETAAPGVETEILSQMRVRPPEYVIVLHRDVSEFGSRGFGVDYDLEIRDFLSERYHVEQAWLPSRFSLVLLRRNG